MVHVPEVHTITSAGRSHTAQQRTRGRIYVVLMAVRLLALAGVGFLRGWPQLVCLVLTFSLPIVAVIMGSSGSERRTMPDTYLDDRALPAAPEREDR